MTRPMSGAGGVTALRIAFGERSRVGRILNQLWQNGLLQRVDGKLLLTALRKHTNSGFF